MTISELKQLQESNEEQIVPITHPDFYTRVSDEPFVPPRKHDAGDLLWTGVDFIPGIQS